MARYPGARWRPIPRYQPGGSAHQDMDRWDAGVDHTYVGSPSPDAAFAHFNVTGTPIPHFMVFRDGSIDQYVDTAFRSSACLDGNHRVIAWETADGYPSLWTANRSQAPKDTPEMVTAKAKLMVWLNKTHGIPLVQLPNSRSTSRGFGWHRQGIDGNFEQPPGQLLGGRVSGGEKWSPAFGKTCPTSVRIHQFVDETIPAAVELAKPKPATRGRGHQSGKFKASKSQNDTMLAYAVKRCTVLAVTESVGLVPPPRWQASGGESKILFDTRVHKLSDEGVVHVPTPKWRRGTSPRTTVELWWSLLDDGDLELVAHTPAHPWNLAANRAFFRQLAPTVIALQKAHKARTTRLSLDANRRMQHKRQQAYVRRHLAGTGLHLLVPPKPTHGRSTIDLIASTEPEALLMFPDFAGLDHRGFRTAA